MATPKSIFEKEVKALTSKIKKINNGPVNEVETSKLPKPVKRFLKYAQVIGQEHAKLVKMKFTGKIRLRPTDSWMGLSVEQVNYITKPTRLAYISGSQWGIIGFSGFDKYENGKTERSMKLMSLFPIKSPKGEEILPIAIISFLSEMAVFPSAFLSKFIEWENVDNLHAKAIIKDQTISVSALFSFNLQDQLVSIESNDCYYSADSVSFEKAKWKMNFSAYKEINGFLIASEVSETWSLKTGLFEASKLKLKSIHLNSM